MNHTDLRSEENLTRETMHLACVYGWLSPGWDQQRYGCQIDKSPYPDSGDLIVDQMEASRIVWSMTNQPSPINHWLFYAYGDDNATDWLWHGRMTACEFRREINYDIPWLALQDFRRRVIGLPRLSDEILITTLSKDKDWKPKYDRILDRIQGWDATGVGYVSVVVREIYEGRRSSQQSMNVG